MARRNETERRKRELESYIRAACSHGTWKIDEMVPSARELAESFQLSFSVVNGQLQKLVEEGLLYSLPRVGTFVRGVEAEQSPLRSEAHVGARLLSTQETVAESGKFLPLSHSDTIAVLSSEAHSQRWGKSGFSDLSWGIGNAISQAGLHQLLLHPNRLVNEHDGSVNVATLEKLMQRHIAGVILADLMERIEPMDGLIRELHKRHVPVVALVGGSSVDEADCVQSDHEGGNYNLTRWLLERGHRRILPIVPLSASTLYWYQARLRGYEKAMAEAGIKPLTPLVHADSPTVPGVREEFDHSVYALVGYLMQHLQSPNPPDALMAVSDGHTFSIHSACRLCGIDPARDLTVVGYDNYYYQVKERAFEPLLPAATVDKNNEALGYSLVELLQSRIGMPMEATPQLRLVPHRLVEIETHEATEMRHRVLMESSPLP